MSAKKQKRIPTQTYRPSSFNWKKLKPLEKKRGERSRIVNAALILYWKNQEAASV